MSEICFILAAEKDGSIIVEETVLNGITDKTFEL